MEKKEWYDTKRLFQDADARIVVRALWQRDDYRQTGSTLFCRCPTGHKETRLDHCAVYKEGCNCFSCGAHFGIMEMVEKYYEGTKTFSEICGMIADAIGHREDYLTDRSAARKEDPFPLNMAELDLIGLSSPENVPGVPKLSVLYKEQPKACRMLLRQRAKEFLEKYRELRDTEENQDLKEEFDLRYLAVEQILLRLGDEKKQKGGTKDGTDHQTGRAGNPRGSGD